MSQPPTTSAPCPCPAPPAELGALHPRAFQDIFLPQRRAPLDAGAPTGTAALELGASDAIFDFPLEVERMVSDLCSTSSAGESCEAAPLGPGLNLGLDFSGSLLADRTSPVAPAKQRSPFSMLAPPGSSGSCASPISARPPEFHLPRPPSPLVTCPGLLFTESAPLPRFSPPPASDGYLYDSRMYLNTAARGGGVAPTTVFPDLPDGGLSFRELVVKGCLELEHILRVHKQHSYIGDLLSFCRAIREAAATASARELDAPSDETRALIIAFFRLVSCWLGLFPCQQELGPEVFREWQLASRKVIIAILRRVPVLRERLGGEAAATHPAWRPPPQDTQGSHPQPAFSSRPAWAKTPAKHQAVGQAAGPAKASDWADGDGMRPRSATSRGSPSPRGQCTQWRGEAVETLGMDGAGALRRTPSHSPRDGWKLAEDSLFPGMAFSLSDAAPRQSAAGRPSTGKGGKKWGADGAGPGLGAGAALGAALAKARHTPRMGTRYDLEPADDLGAYMKPGCYDVPMRCVAAPSAPASTAPPPPQSDTTWQAALASAETLSRALQSSDETFAAFWDSAEAEKAAGAAPGGGSSSSSGSPTPATEGAPEESFKGSKPKQAPGSPRSSGVGPSREAALRGHARCRSVLPQGLGPSLGPSPTGALDAQRSPREAGDAKATPAICKVESATLDSTSWAPSGQVHGSFEFEQDFRRLVFSCTSEDPATVCSAKASARALEKAVADLEGEGHSGHPRRGRALQDPGAADASVPGSGAEAAGAPLGPPGPPGGDGSSEAAVVEVEE